MKIHVCVGGAPAAYGTWPGSSRAPQKLLLPPSQFLLSQPREALSDFSHQRRLWLFLNWMEIESSRTHALMSEIRQSCRTERSTHRFLTSSSEAGTSLPHAPSALTPAVSSRAHHWEEEPRRRSFQKTNASGPLQLWSSQRRGGLRSICQAPRRTPLMLGHWETETRGMGPKLCLALSRNGQ